MSSTGRDSQISILDARLAEIDRRLSGIQSGLDDEELRRPRTPPSHTSTARPPAPRPPEPAAPDRERIARLERLAREQEEVLEKLNELVRVLERLSIPAATQAAGAPAAAAGPVSVSAGPFTSTAALRAFEQQLRALPGVSAVEVRGFEGADRAILEVQLS